MVIVFSDERKQVNYSDESFKRGWREAPKMHLHPLNFGVDEW
jgi:hypothetical protein